MTRPGAGKRPNVLPDDHIAGVGPLRTDYSMFERPTAQARKWAREMRWKRLSFQIKHSSTINN